MKYIIRRSPRHPGVFQQCRQDCPPDRCRVHIRSYTLEVVLGKRLQLGKTGFESAAAAEARAEVQRRYRAGSLPKDMGLGRRTLHGLREFAMSGRA